MNNICEFRAGLNLCRRLRWDTDVATANFDGFVSAEFVVR
jgi:hypothetical protein